MNAINRIKTNFSRRNQRKELVRRGRQLQKKGHTTHQGALPELCLNPDGGHYRCDQCKHIVLMLTEGFIISMSRSDFEKKRRDSSEIRHLNASKFGKGICPHCQPPERMPPLAAEEKRQV